MSVKKRGKICIFEQKVRQVVFGIVKMAYLKALNNFSVPSLRPPLLFKSSFFDERFCKLQLAPKIRRHKVASLNCGETDSFKIFRLNFFFNHLRTRFYVRTETFSFLRYSNKFLQWFIFSVESIVFCLIRFFGTLLLYGSHPSQCFYVYKSENVSSIMENNKILFDMKRSKINVVLMVFFDLLHLNILLKET